MKQHWNEEVLIFERKLRLKRKFTFIFTYTANKSPNKALTADRLAFWPAHQPIKIAQLEFERHFLRVCDDTGKCACIVKIKVNVVYIRSTKLEKSSQHYSLVHSLIVIVLYSGSKMGKRKHSTDSSSGDESDDCCKRLKSKGVRFGEVTVYHFPRKQGFVSVPSAGGSTLGMARRHVSIEKLRIDLEFDATRGNRKPFAPVSQKARKNILKTAGVRRILKKEEQDCAELRLSRVICGCRCGDICYPQTCECILSGIGCQVDYGRFPCSCQPNGCQNNNGRKQYNPGAVERHYFETFARINGQTGGTTVIKYVGVV